MRWGTRVDASILSYLLFFRPLLSLTVVGVALVAFIAHSLLLPCCFACRILAAEKSHLSPPLPSPSPLFVAPPHLRYCSQSHEEPTNVFDFFVLPFPFHAAVLCACSVHVALLEYSTVTLVYVDFVSLL